MPREAVLYRSIALIFFSVFTLGILRVQAQVSISGKVIDPEENSIPFAAVSLHQIADSSLITGTTTAENGNFNLSTPAGNYLVKFSFLSYQTQWKKVEALQSVKLGKIVLKTEAKALEEVEIVGEKSQMTLRVDKRVFNVGSDLTNAGGSAIEVLENVPSVTVDVEGNVALRGSQNARILIDGKPSGLTGISSSDALRTLQGSMVEKIEVITNPSAKYEAEGEAGIINIVLKKEKKKNLNGSFEVNTGFPANHGAAYNLNYRKNKINFFSSFGINYRRGPGYGKSFQEFLNTTDSIKFLERDRVHNRGGLGTNFRFGADYFISEKEVLTVSGLYKYSKGTNTAVIDYNDLNAERELLRLTTRDEEEVETEHTVEAAISYMKEFDEEDRKFTIDFKYINNDDSEEADLVQTVNGFKDLDQRSTNREDEVNWLFQTDYVHPLGDYKFETGLRTTLRTINNDFTVEQREQDEDWQILGPFDNQFEYQENIYAGYLILNAEKGAFSYQAGLRGEYSDISTALRNTNENTLQQYFNLFPSLHLSYELDAKNTVQLSYSRRISRPRFWWLLPFYGYSDNRNFRSGNPNLRPEYTDSYEASYLRYFEKGSILTSAYYRHRTGVIQRITVVDSVGFTRRFPVNLAVQDAYGLEFALNYKPYEWWSINANMNAFYAVTVGKYEGESLNAQTTTLTSRVSTKFTIKKRFDLQVNGNYEAPEQLPQGRRLAIWFVGIGASMDVLDKKGTLTLSGRDIFNTRVRRQIIETANLSAEDEYQWRRAQITLTFTYRLDDKKPSRAGRNADSDNF